MAHGHMDTSPWLMCRGRHSYARPLMNPTLPLCWLSNVRMTARARRIEPVDLLFNQDSSVIHFYE